MTVPFSAIPSTLLVPTFAVEIDNSQAEQGPSLLGLTGLIVGQKTADGTGTSNSFYLVSSANQAATYGGRGSMLHRMAQAWFYRNKSTPVYLAVLADSSSAVVATGTVTITGPATADGTINLYLGGRACQVAVANGDSASTIAAAIAVAIGKHATGTITCASALAADTVTVGGTTFTGASGAVVAGAATFSIDTGNTQCGASLAAQINAHATASTVVVATANSGVVTLRALQSGTSGNVVLLSSNGTRLAVTGAGTLTGASPNQDYGVHASVSSGVVTLYSKNAGTVANEFDVRMNYHDGEALPTGVGAAIVALSGGTTNPTLTSMIAALGDTWRQIWANPYTDATSLTAIENELSDRFGPMRGIPGLSVAAKSASLSTMTTLGVTRNSPHSCIVATNGSPTPPEEYAACLASIVAKYAQQDFARPLQTLTLDWVAPQPDDVNRFTQEERDTLLHTGIGTTKVGPGNVVQIDRLVTTYQLNSVGAPDSSYRDAVTMLTLMYLRYDVRNHFALKFPRHKLANDGALVGPGQAIVTPKIAKAEAVLWFEEMASLGLVEDVNQFKRDLVVERNVSDRNRLDFLLPPNLINQLIVAAFNLQFRL